MATPESVSPPGAKQQGPRWCSTSPHFSMREKKLLYEVKELVWRILPKLICPKRTFCYAKIVLIKQDESITDALLLTDQPLIAIYKTVALLFNTATCIFWKLRPLLMLNLFEAWTHICCVCATKIVVKNLSVKCENLPFTAFWGIVKSK